MADRTIVLAQNKRHAVRGLTVVNPQEFSAYQEDDDDLTYIVDMSSYLDGATISSVTRTPNGVTVSNTSNTTTRLTQRLKGFGYVDINVTSSSGEVEQFRITVKPRANSAFFLSNTGSVPQNTAQLWDVVADVTAASIDNGVSWIRTQGYYTVGDGGAALYKRVYAAPSHGAYITSNAATAYWELAEAIPSVLHCGAKGDGSTNDAAAFQAAYNYCPDGGLIFVPANPYLRNSAVTTTSKKVIWLSDGATNEAATAPLSLPGINETRFESRKLIKQVLETASTDYAALEVQRSSDHTGGDVGVVASAIRATTTTAASQTNFEWGITSVLENYSDAGENVAVYAQGNQRSTGDTWAGVFEVRDFTQTANPLPDLVAVEVDVFANGTDNNFSRVGIDVVGGKGVAAGSAPTIGYGVRIGPQGGTAANCTFTYGNYIYGNVTTSVHIAATGTVGIDTSTATLSGSAIRLARAQKISWEATDTIVAALDGSVNRINFTNGGTERVGLTVTATPGIRINSTQVVGAQDTGWTAMTGTTNKATSYDTSTVTLAQLAGRVMALQAALTTHGLLGP